MFLTFKQTKAFRGKEKGKGPSLSIRFKSKSSKKNKYNWPVPVEAQWGSDLLYNDIWVFLLNWRRYEEETWTFCLFTTEAHWVPHISQCIYVTRIPLESKRLWMANL